jgi:hypothetical protein
MWNKPDRTAWFGSLLFPVNVGYVPCEKDWHKTMKRLGIKSEPFPTSNGHCWVLSEHPKHPLTVLIVINSDNRRFSTEQIAAMVAHEATHAMQFIMRGIDAQQQRHDETEAYLVQSITQQTLYAMNDYRKFRKGRK